ncbi:SET domain-containing protein-lysine N-methyltransferase [Planctomicrobium sp. SH527]|uniref:SET domain-containing protein-lysine N-methyltransferase n=1 Tax=Planctomicrobium sp. SH527 TaxID=3448123 RepID=UPI003F5B0A90
MSSYSESGRGSFADTSRKAGRSLPYGHYEDVGRQTKAFTALRDIQPGEEVTINYNGDPEDKTNDLGFDVLE